MSETHFEYDVFISHSSKDKPVVREIAEQLRADGLKVWFDDWILKPGDSIPSLVDYGLENSRVLLLCMSANAFGSDWAQLESGMYRFRDPLNKERRLIPVRLDDAPIKGSLVQFLYIDWNLRKREGEYARLVEVCRLAKPQVRRDQQVVGRGLAHGAYLLGDSIRTTAFGKDGRYAFTASDDNAVRLWDAESSRTSRAFKYYAGEVKKEVKCLRVFEGHSDNVFSIAISPDQRSVLSASGDSTIRRWTLESSHCLGVFEGHSGGVLSVTWSPDGQRMLSGSHDKTVRMWDVDSGRCLGVFPGHELSVISVAWSPDGRHALSGSHDHSVRLWEVESGRCLHVLKGHESGVYSVEWSPDGRHALSSSGDATARLWEIESGRCLLVLEGHLSTVTSVAWSPDGRYALTGSVDRSVRLWEMESGRYLRSLEGHTDYVLRVAWSLDGRHAYSAAQNGVMRVWNLHDALAEGSRARSELDPTPVAQGVEYTNAKVLLVGESGSGKTGLSRVLAGQQWEPSDSTVGAWATQWKLPVSSTDGVEREIWLWDFGGQADQRLIHQLYMDETALAVHVFNGQKEDVFDTLGQWDRDLTRASRKDFAKLLVAGRVDAGAIRVSRTQVEAFAKERGYSRFLETSAKFGTCCEDLRQAILDGIRWENIPWRSSPLLFKRLKEEIIRLRDENRVLMRFNELREALIIRLAGQFSKFTDEELKAVVSLLAGPGAVWELKFGSWVLLQPERINAYAQAVIQTMREDPHERGCIAERKVLDGELTYHASLARLPRDEERFVLLAMHDTLLERGLCLREQTNDGGLLVFPSFYRRERPDLVGHPAVLVSYRFNGFLDDIYATLVVRLHHTPDFERDQLWRYAADFRTTTGTSRQLGVKMTRRSEGAGELEVYFDPAISLEEKIIFSRYVHEHLLQNANDVVRLRHYVCPHCGTPAGNREVAMRKLAEGKEDIPCVNCDDPQKRIPLWDNLEELFASPELKQRVNDLREQSQIVIDSESKDRVLVGDVISTVELAGQICREKTVSDHGLNMEIEFKDDNGAATGQMLLLQLVSGDSHVANRKRDPDEVFKFKDEEHARYWMAQPFPVMLVIRDSEGEVGWMEIRDRLKQVSEDGTKPVKRLLFDGERLDVMSVRRWRERMLRPVS